MGELLHPPRAANRLNNLAEEFSKIHGTNRFPVNVEELALEAASIFRWADPISRIEATDINNFQGALIPVRDKREWLLLYNNAMPSAGRIRFTQAHELGHYILHRQQQDSFMCTESDIFIPSESSSDIEKQADQFASYLLMPIDDYRNQIEDDVTLDVLSHCAKRYGVSLTAAILKWLEYTDEKAVLVVSTDGYVNWACSSSPARSSGAFFRTRIGRPILVPEKALASNTMVKHSRAGQNVDARVWFPHAEPGTSLREMKLQTDYSDQIITLLHLPRYVDVWEPRPFTS